MISKRYSKKFKPTQWHLRIHTQGFKPQLKELYNYFVWFDQRACIQWNCRLAKKFGVSRRTIKRRLKRLVELKLIWITSGGGAHRRIHCRHYKNSHEWLTTLAIPKATTSPRVNRVYLSEGQFQDRVRIQRNALLNTL